MMTASGSLGEGGSAVGYFLIGVIWVAGIAGVIAALSLLLGLVAVFRGAGRTGSWAAIFAGVQLAIVVVVCVIGLVLMVLS
jgi:chromate transport protein ChrA